MPAVQGERGGDVERLEQPFRDHRTGESQEMDVVAHQGVREAQPVGASERSPQCAQVQRSFGGASQAELAVHDAADDVDRATGSVEACVPRHGGVFGARERAFLRF